MFSADAAGQANLIPGTNVKLAKMDLIAALGHQGTFPGGINGLVLSTTACNIGTVKIPWEAPMKEDHAVISFMVTRESNGRFEQISDRSFVKHGYSALTTSFCSTCQEGPFGGGDILGLGCSDTYSTISNGDMYYLGPPEEIDPWLGTWSANCSYFDLGLAPAPNCDSQRSLSQAQAASLGPVGTRVNVRDADLNVSGANYFYQGFYTVRGEAQSLRNDNIGHRQFNPTWNGSKWNTPSPGGDFQNGPILSRWSGAKVTKASNGVHDGAIYGGVKVTGPVNGIYHYEYALQNRDNNRGVGAFTLPICSGARVFNAGFKDLDHNSVTDWTVTASSNSLTWSGPSNALRWNTMYNFWFDSDAAPTDGFAMLDAADPGAGLNTLVLATTTPEGLYNVYLGDGCANGTAPTLFATGNPAQATIGNASFGLGSTGNQPSSGHFLFMSLLNGSTDLGSGCTMYLGGAFGSSIVQVGTGTTDAAGDTSFPVPVPPSPALEGLAVNFQGLGFNAGGGPVSSLFELTNGLRVHVGSALPVCP
jgi:hypothetical protein